jgi:hypothetical protein
VWDTRRDLMACFMWKQVRLGFFSLASRLAEVQQRIVHVVPSRKLRRVQAEDERVDTIDCIGPYYHYFIVFIVLGPKSNLVF